MFNHLLLNLLSREEHQELLDVSETQRRPKIEEPTVAGGARQDIFLAARVPEYLQHAS